jgi:hypothetical protein
MAWDGGRPWAECGTDAEGGGARSATRGARAREMSRCYGALPKMLLSTCLNTKNSIFLNKTALNFEYEIYRSSYPLPFSKILHGVFLNIFGKGGFPTLNVSLCP